MRLKKGLILALLLVFFLIVGIFLPRTQEQDFYDSASDKVYRQLKTAIHHLEGYYLTDELLVFIDEEDSIEEYEDLLNASMVSRLKSGAIRMKINDGYSFTDIINAHRFNDSLLEKVFPHKTYKVLGSQLDEGEAPHFDVLNILDALELSTGEGVSIAVIDSGIDFEHEAFEGIVSELSYNAFTKEVGIEHVMDYGGHGSGVAGVITHRYSGFEHQGVAPDVELVVIKATEGQYYNQEDIEEALEYAMEIDVDIINMSFGGPAIIGYDEAEQIYNSVLDKAYDLGIIMVAGAGNESNYAPVMPAAHPKVISVGSTTYSGDASASYSSLGNHVDLVVPGSQWSIQTGGGSRLVAGTSIASPTVAGIVALYLSLNPGATFEEVYGMLTSTANDIRDPGKDIDFGFGLVDAYNFITAEKGVITFIDSMNNTTYQKTNAINYPIVDVWRPVDQKYVYGGYSYDSLGESKLELYHDVLSDDTTLYKQWLPRGSETHSDLFLFRQKDDESFVLTSYLGDEQIVNIPSRYLDKRIEAIHSNAITNKILHRLRIGKSIETIKENAIMDNYINHVDFDSATQLTRIERLGFNNIKHLTEIILPSSLIEIDDYAFHEIVDLSYVYIGENVESIGVLPFSILYHGDHYGDFDYIEVHPDNQNYRSIDGVLYDYAMETLMLYPAQKSDTSFTIPKTVKKLEAYAFFRSNYLEELNINENLKDLGGVAFEFLELKAIHVDYNNPYFTSYKGVLYDKTKSVLLHYPIHASQFEIVIPKTVKYYHDHAFIDFINLSNYGEFHTVLFLGDDFEGDMIDPNLIETWGFNKDEIKPLDDVFERFSLLGIFIETVYLSDTMKVTLNSQYQDELNNRFDFSIKAYDTLKLNEGTLKESYHFDYQVTIDFDIVFEQQAIGNVLLKSIIDLDDAFGDTDDSHVDIHYLNKTLSLDLPFYPSVSFNVFGGELLESLTFDISKANIDDLPEAVKKGHTFVGWYLDEDYNVIFDETTISSALNLYAKFEPKMYTVEFHYHDEVITKNYLYNEVIDYIVEGENEVLTGWLTDSQENYLLHAMPANDLVLYAHFEPRLSKEIYEDYQFVIEDGFAYITDYYGSNINIELPYYFETMDGEIYYILGNKSSLFFDNQLIEKVVYPNHYQSIGHYTFFNAGNLREVKMPSMLQAILPSTFERADSLETITIPSQVESIGKNAFAETTSLAHIDFDNESNLNTIYSNAFSGAAKVKNLIIPDSVEIIYRGAFSQMTSLESLKLPSRLTVIPAYMASLTRINTIDFPDSVREIRDNSFYRTMIQDTVVLPEKVTYLSSFTFGNSHRLETLILSESITHIHSNGFGRLENLKKIEVDNMNRRFIEIEGMLLSFDQSYLLFYPNNNPHANLVVPNNVERIAPYVFYRANNLRSITIPKSVVSLGEGIFSEAKNLEHVELPNHLRVIPKNAFNGTTSLTHIDLPDKLEVIEVEAFRNSGLKSIVVPESVNAIRRGAFINTNQLKTAVLPHNIKIDLAIFSHSSVKEVFFKGDVDYFTYEFMVGELDPFYNTNELNSIYVHQDFESHLAGVMDYYMSWNLNKIQSFDDYHLSEDYQNIGIDDAFNEIHLDLLKQDQKVGQLSLRYFLDYPVYKDLSLLDKGINVLSVRRGDTLIDIEFSLEEEIKRIRYYDIQDVMIHQEFLFVGQKMNPILPRSIEFIDAHIYRFDRFDKDSEIVVDHQHIHALYDTYLIDDVFTIIGSSELIIRSTEPDYELDIMPGFEFDYQLFSNLDMFTLGDYLLEFVIYDSMDGREHFTLTYEVSVIARELIFEFFDSDRILVNQGEEFSYPGVNCRYDNGDWCFPTIDGEVDSNTLGEYIITYSVIDDYGKVQELELTVVVVSSLLPAVKLNVNLDTVMLGDDYHDEGVDVIHNYDTTVEVSGDVNTSVPGQYTLTYLVTDVLGNETVINRIVTVIDASPTIEFELNDAKTTLRVGETYQDTGCKALVNGDELDCSLKENNVETSQTGVYTVVYTVTYQNEDYTYKRYVFVKDGETPLALHHYVFVKDGETPLALHHYGFKQREGDDFL